MSVKVWRRKNTPAGHALEEGLNAVRLSPAPAPITRPSEDLAELQADGDSFTLASFTTQDAWDLGHLLYARLLPYAAAGKPTVISVSLANGGQTVFQCVTGPGIVPDNESWVARKKASVLRWGCSSWFLHCKFRGDAEAFGTRYGMGREAAGKYAIHGGGVPIRVHGVEGTVGVVVVSGLAQHEDHGVICDVIKANWE